MKKHWGYLLTVVIISALLLTPDGDLAAKGKKKVKAAKNIILLIGDGMGPGHIRATQLYCNRILNGELNMVKLMNDGHTAYVANDTADSMVTESAAAAGQMATGQKMTARTISMASDGKTPVKTILEMAKENGMATGIVTTSGITDATPAAFSTHESYRNNETSIAEQQVKSGIDVIMGGRKQNFLPENNGGKRKDGRDLLSEARKSGYSVVETGRGLQLTPSRGKILGLFNMSNMTWDYKREGTFEPSLSEMTSKTLQILSENKNGFFAMIEGGRIDHASHGNDVACMIYEVLAFDAAVGTAMDFAAKHPDTLVIVTADHETGGFAMIGKSKESKEYVGLDLEAISKIKTPFEKMADMIKKDPTPQNAKAIVKKYAFIDLTDEEAKALANDSVKKLDPANYIYDYQHTLAFVLRPYLRAAWSSQTHTSMPLFMFGSGPGSDMIKGYLHNTQIFTIMKDSIGLK